jgi:hypothetical protein
MATRDDLSPQGVSAPVAPRWVPPFMEYLVLLGLFVSWAGFWFAVFWWIV